MGLIILNTMQRGPVALWDLKASETVEGGMVGELTNVAGVGGYAESPTAYKVVVQVSKDPTGLDLNVLGIIDDTTTGSKYGTNLGTTIYYPGGSSTTTQPTTAASGKCTLWMTPGIYATDEFSDTVDPSTFISVGTPLYASLADGRLTDDVGQVANNKVVANFIEFTTPNLLGARVSPAYPNEVWMVFKFMGAAMPS